MKLATQKPWMVRNLHNLNKLTIRRFAGENQTVSAKFILVTRIELVTMSMSFANRRRAINLIGQRTTFKLARVGTESHRAAHRFNSDQVPQLENYRMSRIVVELRRISALEPANITGEFNGRTLHAQTDSEIRGLLTTSVINCSQHARNSSLAKTAWHQNRVKVAKAIFPIWIVH